MDVPAGAELRSRRLALGLSQAALAQALGVAPNTVARWERGELRIGNPARVQRYLDQLQRSAPSRVELDSPRHVPGNLPVELSTFVGRQSALAALADAVDSARLLTLSGPGGVGKTRLAVRLAQTVFERFANGVWLVELASVNEPGLVPSAVAAALRVREPSDATLTEALVAYVGQRQMLLVFDNCEHLADACGRLAHTLLSRCPGLRILATSRQPLSIAAETVWQVPPLELDEASHLFVERARATRASFDVPPRLQPTLEELCRRLEGIPLAIELAAVRARALGLEQIAVRLEDRFRFLAAPQRAGPERHQTLRAAVDWSYELLDPDERTLFSRLSVFAGGWTLEAAEQVCSSASMDVLDVLERLVERSLVLVDERAGDVRYRMLETLRQYAQERLVEHGEQTMMRERHCAWCSQLALTAAREMWRADQVLWLERLRRERDNIRAALSWTLSGSTEHAEPGVRLAAAMVRFWDADGDLQEGTEWLSSVLALPGAERRPAAHAQAMTALGYLLVVRGEQARAIALLDQALTFWRSVGDPRALAVAVFFRGVALGWYDMAAQDEYTSLMEESLALARVQGPRWVETMALLSLGEGARVAGDRVRAETLLSQGLALAQEVGERWGSYHGFTALALLALSLGEVATAAERAREALRMAHELDDTRAQTYVLEVLAAIAVAEGRPADAVRVFGAAERHRAPIGELMLVSWRTTRERGLGAARAALDAAAFDAAWLAGQEMTLEEAAVIAVASRNGSPRRGGSRVKNLTPRESEVLRLVVQGKTNREIGEALVVSHRTVKRHLDNIFAKLEVPSRSAAAAIAVRRGIA